MKYSTRMVQRLACMVLVCLTAGAVTWAAPCEGEIRPGPGRGKGTEGPQGRRRGRETPKPEEKAANRGVLNGPLMTGGHRAKGEGDRQSLKLAIEDLIATYGDKYPKGKEFLKRLEAIQSERSAEFEALKKEALLANPLLDFDHLLMVRSRKGKRFASNWQTQASVRGGRRVRRRTGGDVADLRRPGQGRLPARRRQVRRRRGPALRRRPGAVHLAPRHEQPERRRRGKARAMRSSS